MSGGKRGRARGGGGGVGYAARNEGGGGGVAPGPEAGWLLRQGIDDERLPPHSLDECPPPSASLPLCRRAKRPGGQSRDGGPPARGAREGGRGADRLERQRGEGEGERGAGGRAGGSPPGPTSRGPAS